MSWERVRQTSSRMESGGREARAWLRRVMPRVAVAALALLIVWLLVRGTSLYRSSIVGDLFGLLAFCIIALVAVYYGLRAALWLKRKLLWRVRRRLIITYLFIGLTPIVLLGLLSMLSALVGISQAMTRIVVVQVNTVERQTLASARTLAETLSRLPPETSDRDAQRWLDERASLLHGALPGASVAVWRGAQAAGAAELGTLGQLSEAQLSSVAQGEETRGVGGDETPVGAPLPGWLGGRAEWSGFAFMPPRDADEPFGSPSVRALVRRNVNGRNVAVLLVVPVSRALMQQLRDNVGFRLQPFFLGADELEAKAEGNNVSIKVGGEGERERRAGEAAGNVTRRAGQPNFRRDQFGEEIKGQRYLVLLPSTNWSSGETGLRLSFMMSLSWIEAGQQLLGNSEIGRVLKRVLLATALVFLLLELLALFAAAWMTRAVTGTVHKLYRATEFIKRGDFSHRVRVRSHDQLGELAGAFNEMSANIESLLKERVERERLEREVEIAAEVQAQLFPRRVPHLSTLEIAGECRAARGVAGDYYDYVEVAPGLVAFALGDVSGKGISASLVMSNLQASLRAQTTIIAERLRRTGHLPSPASALSNATTSNNVGNVGSTANSAALTATTATALAGDDGAEPPCGVTGIDRSCAVEQMVTSINEQLCESTDANRFATLFLALYDDRTQTLRFTNAGHNAPLHVRADGTLEQLSIGGMMVGAFDWATFEEARARLDAGDVLVIYSDGISEAQNVLGEEYGEARLMQFAVKHRHLSADEMLRRIFDEIDNWSGEQERGDDQTLVILKGRGGRL